MAAHVIRAHLEAAKSRGITGAVLCIDLWSGFYTMVRQLVMRVSADPEDWAEILGSLNIPRCCEDALTALIAEPSVVEKFGLDPRLAAMLAEAHTDMWFRVEGKAEVARKIGRAHV